MVLAIFVGMLCLPSAVLFLADMSAMNLLMHPQCPISVRASWLGIGAATSLIAFAALRLARQVAVRDDAPALTASRQLWMGAAALWIGTACALAYIVVHTSWSGVFDNFCHL